MVTIWPVPGSRCVVVPCVGRSVFSCLLMVRPFGLVDKGCRCRRPRAGGKPSGSSGPRDRPKGGTPDAKDVRWSSLDHRQEVGAMVALSSAARCRACRWLGRLPCGECGVEVEPEPWPLTLAYPPA